MTLQKEILLPKKNALIHENIIMKSDNKKFQVCRKMFLNTLGIKEKMVRCWLNSKIEFGFFENPEDVEQRKTKRRQQSEKYKEYERRKDYLRDFFIKFPKLESHYCRKDSSDCGR